MNTEPTPIVPEVALDDGISKTTSLEVARIFGKAHKNVLRGIEQTLTQVLIRSESLILSRSNTRPKTIHHGGLQFWREARRTSPRWKADGDGMGTVPSLGWGLLYMSQQRSA
jgi:hypothetical protein